MVWLSSSSGQSHAPEPLSRSSCSSIWSSPMEPRESLAVSSPTEFFPCHCCAVCTTPSAGLDKDMPLVNVRGPAHSHRHLALDCCGLRASHTLWWLIQGQLAGLGDSAALTSGLLHLFIVFDAFGASGPRVRFVVQPLSGFAKCRASHARLDVVTAPDTTVASRQELPVAARVTRGKWVRIRSLPSA